MKEECNQGGRYLQWIGYRSKERPIVGSDLSYLGMYEPLTIEGWRPRQPNAKNGDQCLISYLSLEPNASWYDFDCEQSSWEWGACTSCLLPNSFYKSTIVTARGLCARTNFDTEFEVMNDQEGYVMFKGKKNTIITYDPEAKLWSMQIVNRPSIYATSESSFPDLLMGMAIITLQEHCMSIFRSPSMDNLQ